MEEGCVFYRDSLRLPPLLRDTQHARRERMDVRLSYDLTWLHRRPSISLPPVDSYATEGLCRPIVFKDCPSPVAGPSRNRCPSVLIWDGPTGVDTPSGTQ